tara:strand:- start:32425 stop:33105 length:681 start_codon:yes stop_codon:yes gene_type:complete
MFVAMDKPSGALSMVLVPAAISLAITVVRLVGELQGWDESLFRNSTPGEEGMPAIIGISWLVPIFGFWFGRKLKLGTGGPASLGKASIRFLIATAVLIGGFAACIGLGLLTMPSKDAPAEPAGLEYVLGLVIVAIIIGFTAWPRLAATLLLYGLLARIPVIAVTWFALENDWDSHYTKLPVGTVLADEGDRFAFLAVPQLTVWIVFTILVGGLFGCLGAKLTKGKS